MIGYLVWVVGGGWRCNLGDWGWLRRLVKHFQKYGVSKDSNAKFSQPLCKFYRP